MRSGKGRSGVSALRKPTTMSTGELELPPHIVLLDRQDGSVTVDDTEPSLAQTAPDPTCKGTEDEAADNEAAAAAAPSTSDASAADECPPTADSEPTGLDSAASAAAAAAAADAPARGEEDEGAGTPETNDDAQNEKPMTSAGEISNAASDVRVYDGLPAHGLDQAQIDELFAAVHEMKSKSSASNFFKHGWQLIYTLRTPGSSTRGDMCVIDPRDGQKIFSIVGLRRKLGLEEAMERSTFYPRAKVSRTAEDEAARAALLLTDREPRRSRATVNYAEKLGDVRGRPGEHISAVLAQAGEQGHDLASLAEAVHARMGSDSETPVPYQAVRQTLIGMLRSGRVRRRLRTQPNVTPGDSESALRLIVLNTMQVEPDRSAPWSLEVRGPAHALQCRGQPCASPPSTGLFTTGLLLRRGARHLPHTLDPLGPLCTAHSWIHVRCGRH